MIFDTMRVGRSPFFERKAKIKKATSLQKAEAELCLQCQEINCNGNCENLKIIRDNKK